jgi:hypothetical protein
MLLAEVEEQCMIGSIIERNRRERHIWQHLVIKVLRKFKFKERDLEIVE